MKKRIRDLLVEPTLNELPPARIPEAIVWIEAQDADTGDLAEVLAFARGKYQIKDR